MCIERGMVTLRQDGFRKVREGITSYEDPGWFKPPKGTLAYKVS